jgi:hypothetical protein
MHRFYLTLILLSVPASTAVLAHSGTDQEDSHARVTSYVSAAS